MSSCDTFDEQGYCDHAEHMGANACAVLCGDFDVCDHAACADALRALREADARIEVAYHANLSSLRTAS